MNGYECNGTDIFMRQGMFIYLEHPVPFPIMGIIHPSILDYCILSIFHYSENPLSHRTLILTS